MGCTKTFGGQVDGTSLERPCLWILSPLAFDQLRFCEIDISLDGTKCRVVDLEFVS
jgi:hypothetical protein